MAENQTFIQIAEDDYSKEVEYNLKLDINESKIIYNENMNYKTQSFNQINFNNDKVKEDVMSSSNSNLSSTPFRQQYFLHQEKNSEFHGAFNNFHNIIDHKNYLNNQSKNYLNLTENSKKFILSQNSYSKTISIPNSYSNINKNIFQTFNKLIQNKNLKILKEEKDSNNYASRKCDSDKNNPNILNKKIKQNEVLFEHLINASEKLFMNGHVSMDELNSLPAKDKTDSDNDYNLKDDEKIQSNYNKNKIRKCENKNCNSIGTKKNLKQNWTKIKVSKGKLKWLCWVCSKAFKNKQYCYYCISIYKDNNNNFDGKDWICCDLCDLWHHINCEKIYYNKNIDKYLKQNPDYKYICPWCRNKEKLIKDKMKNKKVKKKEIEDENIDDFFKQSIIGKKQKNTYSNENFEFQDFKPRILRKNVSQIQPIFNHLSSLNLNDNRDIYHDFYKIMNENIPEDLKNK